MFVFTGLNNLTDITMDRKYYAICGYTENDINNIFKYYIFKCANSTNIIKTR